MYATLSKAGYPVKNYAEIKSYGDLLKKLNGSVITAPAKEKKYVKEEIKDEKKAASLPAAIGVDMEHIENLPKAIDFREDEFYKLNFTNKEISYALLKPRPYETLAGLFCAKEAICKADNEIKELSFNEIEIEHSSNGAPHFKNFSLSISHSNGFAIAVAYKNA
jgi:holo-[acyl-carrier protein] synthase